MQCLRKGITFYKLDQNSQTRTHTLHLYLQNNKFFIKIIFFRNDCIGSLKKQQFFIFSYEE